jgi:hypothetical protein
MKSFSMLPKRTALKWSARAKADDAEIQMESASRLKKFNTLYTNSLKLIGSRGHMPVDAHKRPKLGRHRS